MTDNATSNKNKIHIQGAYDKFSDSYGHLKLS